MGADLSRFLPPPETWPQRTYTLPIFQTYPEQLNAVELLLDRWVREGQGHRIAVLFEDQRITYAELAERVDRCAIGLAELGLSEGDRVLLRVGNVPEALVANFALLKLGAVVVPSSPLFSRAELAHVANDAEIVAAVVAAPLLEEFERARGEMRTLRHVVVVGGEAETMRQRGYLPFHDVLARGRGSFAAVRRARRDVAVLLYTSGTTGRPKGTAHLMEELLVVPDSFGQYGWRVRSDDVVGGPAPISLAAGYSTVASIPFRFGAAVSLIPRFDPARMFQTIQDHRITVLTMLPTAYRKMLALPDAERYDLSSLRLCTGGGESLTADTFHRWRERFGMEIHEGFGTTEMMYVFISNAVAREARPGSIGWPVPGYEIQVVDEQGESLPPGEPGRLIVRGPTGTLYWRDVDRQRTVVRDGWNVVGDYMRRDDDGYVWFVSREDDLIKSSGYRIGPEEVEQALVKHPAVLDAAVVGVPDPIRGQNAKAFVVLRPGSVASEELKEDILRFLRSEIAVYKLPRLVDFVDELPRSPTGKLLRRVLREREASPSAPAS